MDILSFEYTKNDNELKHIPMKCCQCTKCERDGIIQKKLFKHPCTGKKIQTGIDCTTCKWGDGEIGCGIKKFFGVV